MPGNKGKSYGTQSHLCFIVSCDLQEDGSRSDNADDDYTESCGDGQNAAMMNRVVN